jgi:hypothetical protein
MKNIMQLSLVIIIAGEYMSIALTICIQQLQSAEMKCSVQWMDSTANAPSTCLDRTCKISTWQIVQAIKL